jgi:hypothetical protein
VESGTFPGLPTGTVSGGAAPTTAEAAKNRQDMKKDLNMRAPIAWSRRFT